MRNFWYFIPLCGWLFGCASEKPPLPNIIIVLADDLGYGDIGAFNQESKIKTPHLDQMAAEGLIATDAHSPAAVCTPTRYGILTGRYPWRSRLKRGVLTGNSSALIPNDRTTIASLLKEKGYATGFVGKWHLGWDWAVKEGREIKGEGWNAGDFDAIDFTRPINNGPKELGFDYSFGHAGSLDMAPYVYVENGRVTAPPDRVTVDEGQYSWWRRGPTGADFIHEQVTPLCFEKASAFIQEQSMEAAPFFLYLALPSPHTPVLPTREWEGQSGLLPYADFMMMIDHYMGQLMAKLPENTLIFFTSDNGASPAGGIEAFKAFDHYSSYIYRGHKADLYEGGHRVPFIAHWSERIEPGSVVSQPLSLTDFMATFSELIDRPLDNGEGEDSFSFLSWLDRRVQDDELTSSQRVLVQQSIDGNLALRMGDYKLLAAPGSGGWSFPKASDTIINSLPPYQLYHIVNDPGETVNLWEDQKDFGVTLIQQLEKLIADGRSRPGESVANDNFDGNWAQIEFDY